MRSADNKLFIYEKCQLVETICQLRFPAILSIEANVPADFQALIREAFPRYECRTETLPAGGGTQTVKNHCFFAPDGASRINLTKDFISLSTVRYTGWERFAHLLDEPLGQLIRIYKPTYFERIGLRYLNGFSRTLLGLEDRRWNDLIQSQYLGVLDDGDIDEASVSRCTVDVERRLDERCKLRVHAGPGNVQRTIRTEGGVQTMNEPEPRFILDLDVFAAGQLRLETAAETLEQLHGHADRLFSEAITDTLHEALEPVEI